MVLTSTYSVKAVIAMLYTVCIHKSARSGEISAFESEKVM